jgi:hypothetical protein
MRVNCFGHRFNHLIYGEWCRPQINVKSMYLPLEVKKNLPATLSPVVKVLCSTVHSQTSAFIVRGDTNFHCHGNIV